jgi:hypothetical protein
MVSKVIKKRKGYRHNFLYLLLTVLLSLHVLMWDRHDVLPLGVVDSADRLRRASVEEYEVPTVTVTVDARGEASNSSSSSTTSSSTAIIDARTSGAGAGAGTTSPHRSVSVSVDAGTTRTGTTRATIGINRDSPPPPPAPMSTSQEEQEQAAILPLAEPSIRLMGNDTYIRDSIERILHYPQRASIQIQLFPNCSCCNPYLIGRLSGPHLAMIKWQTPRPDGILTGTYDVPKEGRYFVEILGMICQSFKLEDTYDETCLEEPDTGRLTAESAYIDVVKTKELAGYWEWSNHNDSLPLSPLQTRYQPQKCRFEPDISSARCTKPTSLDRFEPYRFIWKNKYAEQILRNHHFFAKHHQHLCLIGRSHSREMRGEFIAWLDHFNITNVNVTQIELTYPSSVKDKQMDSLVIGLNCTRSLVALGQWAASRRWNQPHLPPISFKKFRKDMIAVVKRFQLRSLQLYLRNIHYNPLGDLKLTCPPGDWRSPPVIDMYNTILQNISASMGVPYIDGTSVLSPFWDSAKDYNHYRNDGATQEALHILSHLLSGADAGGGTSVA